MEIELITQPTGWSHDEWNELATAHPFLQWEWLGSWWNHYGKDGQLFVVAIKEGGKIVCLAPWYIEKTLRGRTIRFLGSGKVCTDHMSLMCRPEQAIEYAAAIAKFLLKNDQWDQLQLVGVDQDDPAITHLFNVLAQQGLSNSRKPGLPCYGISLPRSWDEYQSRRSKSGKHECRKIRKWIDAGKFTFFTPTSLEELEASWFEFVDMHQRRREAVGEQGCFNFHPFGEFLWEASTKLLESGHLQLTFVYQDGMPIAAQYALKSDDTLYFYQSGLNTDYMKYKPGQIVLLHTIADSIEKGRKYFDMMRGDEPYKMRWRGEEQATEEFRVAAPRLVPRIQLGVWQTKKAISQAVHSARDYSVNEGRG